MKTAMKNTIVLCVCTFMVLGFYMTYGFITRNNLKKQCDIGMDCRCFANIVDNRLSGKQIRGFTKFLGEMKKYPTANILEFIDEEDAVALSKVLSICRLNNANNHENQNHDLVNNNETK